MDLNLEGSKIIVSAGGSGIGLAIVQGFLAEGAKVATCDISPELVSQLRQNYPGVYCKEVDVADAQAVQKFTQSAIGQLGGLDCLVNNAGIAGPTSPIEEIQQTDWERCLSVCLSSQYFFTKAAVSSLRKSKNSSIVNLSSAAGKCGFAFRTPYSTAKWGVIGLTKSLSIELGPDQIRVNAILPGLVSGERQQLVLTAKAEKRGVPYEEIEQEAFSYTSIKSYVTPQDIANQVLYLAAEKGKLISGQAISVDGDTRMLA